MDFIFEFIKFLKERKKYWLYPIIIILSLFVGNFFIDLLLKGGFPIIISISGNSNRFRKS